MDSLDSPTPEFTDRLDARMVTIPCYEPAGFEIHLTGRTLATHTLLLGATGSGKSSILRWFQKSLIQNPESRGGLFIFDLNCDDTVNLIRRWAGEASRSEDVRLLTPSTGHLDLFHDVRSLDDLPVATAHFMRGDWVSGSDNSYWSETTQRLIHTALTVCLTATGQLNTETVIRLLINWLIGRQLNAEDEVIFKTFTAMVKAAPGQVDKRTLSKLQFANAAIDMWAKLDSKTKSILTSCVLNAVGPLIASETRQYLDPERGRLFCPEDIVNGRILVFSLPAGKHLEAAKFLGQTIKARLYLALQDRKQDRNQPLCAVVADEYHYLASGGVERASDVTALATLRSRNVAVIAATQSLDGLASVMGGRDFRSLIPNFGNQFFLRSTESTTGAFATAIMGSRKVRVRGMEEHGDIQIEHSPQLVTEWVCPPGALAQLEPCRAYVALADGFRSRGPIWCAGNYDLPSSVVPDRKKANEKSPMDTLGNIREAIQQPGVVPPGKSEPEYCFPSELGDPTAMKYSYRAWERLIQEKRFQRTRWTSFHQFQEAVAKNGHCPEGLEHVPICWWDALVRLIADLNTGPEHCLSNLTSLEGEMALIFVGAPLSASILAWIERVRRSLYPVRTRPLKERDVRLVIDELDDQLFLAEDYMDEADERA